MADSRSRLYSTGDRAVVDAERIVAQRCRAYHMLTSAYHVAGTGRKPGNLPPVPGLSRPKRKHAMFHQATNAVRLFFDALFCQEPAEIANWRALDVGQNHDHNIACRIIGEERSEAIDVADMRDLAGPVK